MIEGQHSQLVTNRILKKNKANTGWQIYACMANTLVDYLCVALNVSEHIKFVIQLLEKATKSSSRAYLGFSVIDVVDGISQLAVNESNNKQAS